MLVLRLVWKHRNSLHCSDEHWSRLNEKNGVETIKLPVIIQLAYDPYVTSGKTFENTTCLLNSGKIFYCLTICYQ